jgi:hypothetical protein
VTFSLTITPLYDNNHVVSTYPSALMKQSTAIIENIVKMTLHNITINKSELKFARIILTISSTLDLDNLYDTLETTFARGRPHVLDETTELFHYKGRQLYAFLFISIENPDILVFN